VSLLVERATILDTLFVWGESPPVLLLNLLLQQMMNSLIACRWQRKPAWYQRKICFNVNFAPLQTIHVTGYRNNGNLNKKTFEKKLFLMRCCVVVGVWMSAAASAAAPQYLMEPRRRHVLQMTLLIA